MVEYVIVWGFLITCVLFLLWVAYQFYEGWYGEKCPHCKCRSLKWLMWHQMKKDEYEGWIWCPVCLREKWRGVVSYAGYLKKE